MDITRSEAVKYCAKCPNLSTGGFIPQYTGVKVPCYCKLAKRLGSGTELFLGIAMDGVIEVTESMLFAPNNWPQSKLEILKPESNTLTIPNGCPYELDFVMLKDKLDESNNNRSAS